MLRLLRVITAGESHGPAMVGILEGLPAGIPVRVGRIQELLVLRRSGYGRGGRARAMEEDRVVLLSGVWRGQTTGAPVAIRIENRGTRPVEEDPPWYVPRPGHADFAGRHKYGLDDIRPVNERASARETVIRTALGGLALAFLETLDIHLLGYVEGIGGLRETVAWPWEAPDFSDVLETRRKLRNSLPTLALSPEADRRFQDAVDHARSARTTLGGVVAVVGGNLPVGLGSFVHWDRRLDARLAGMLLSIPSVKGVEIGEAVETSSLPGREAQDPFLPGAGGRRAANRAGGVEGGVTNGMPLFLRLYVKPLPTQPDGLPSMDLRTGKPARSPYVRSDVCVVPAVAVIAEALTALVLADAILERYGGDTLADLRERVARDRLPSEI